MADDPHHSKGLVMRSLARTFLALALLAGLPMAVRGGVMVEPSCVDLGAVRLSERPSLSFDLLNDGAASVRIVELVRTCICGTLSVDTPVLAPGGRAVLQLTFDPSVLPDGPFLKTFYVRTDDARCAVLAVTARGTVSPEWRITPSRHVHLADDAATAVFDIRSDIERADFSRCRVRDAEGRVLDGSVVLSSLPDGVRVAFTPPPSTNAAFRTWTLDLRGGGEAQLCLSVSSGREAVWRCEPHRVRLPRSEGEQDVEIPIRLVVDAAARTRVAVVRPERIVLVDAPSGVRLVPDGTVTWKAVPMRVRISAAAARSWRSQTLRIALPDGLGTADLFVEIFGHLSE